MIVENNREIFRSLSSYQKEWERESYTYVIECMML